MRGGTHHGRVGRAATVAVLALAGVAAALALGAGGAAGGGAADLATFSGPFGTTTTPSPSIAVTVTASTSSYLVGVPFTVTIQVADGNVSAPNAGLTVGGYDPQLTVQTVSSDTGTCSGAGSPAITCSFGALVPGSTANVTMTVAPASTGAFKLTAAVSGALAGPPGALSGSVSAPSADLSVRVTGASLRTAVGRTLRLGVVVANAGPVASGATLAVSLPPETRLQSAVAHGGSCARVPLSCTLGQLGAQASALVVLTLRITRAGTGTLVASVSGSLADPVPGNDSAGVRIVATPAPRPARR